MPVVWSPVILYPWLLQLSSRASQSRHGCAPGGSPFCPCGPLDVSRLGRGCEATLQVASLSARFLEVIPRRSPSLVKSPDAPEDPARLITAALRILWALCHEYNQAIFAYLELNRFS